MNAGVFRTPLSPELFYGLYRGALSIRDERERVDACHTVLFCGRLGLALDELRHLHPGWVDWELGTITVPSFEPCACVDCWKAARREARTADTSVEEALSRSRWSPPATTRARTIRFGWSRRLTAVLAASLDWQLAAEFSRESVRSRAELLTAAAANAPPLDIEEPDVETLRATAGRFFAEVGFDAAEVGRTLGVDRTDGSRFVRQWGATATAGEFGQLTVPSLASQADFADRYPLVCDPTPFEGEPFDPREFDADWRAERADDSSDTDLLSSPLPPVVPDDVSYDLDRHRQLGDTRIDDDYVEAEAPNRAPVSTVGEWVAECERERTETPATPDDPPTGGGGGRAAAGGSDSHQRGRTERSATDRATRERSATDRATPRGGGSDADGEATANSVVSADSSASSETSVTTSRTHTASDTRDDPGSTTHGSGESSSSVVSGGESLLPREQITGSIRQEVSTHFAVADLNGGQPTNGRVLLGDEEILFVIEENTALEVQFGEITDIAVNYVPSEMDDVFDSTVGVAYRRDSERRLAIAEFPGKKRLDFSNALFRSLLDGERVVVTHPARVGGRVTDESPRYCSLHPGGRTLAVEDGETTVAEIELSSLMHAEHGQQSIDGEARKAIQIRHYGRKHGEPVTTEITPVDQKIFTFLERLVMRDYRRRKEELQQLELSADEKQVVVALYSVGSGMDISMLLDLDPDALEAVLGQLEEKGLVKGTSDGCTLTPMGELTVNEKIDDVNV